MATFKRAPKIQRLYAQAFEAFTQSHRKIGEMEKEHEMETDAMRRELETLRQYRDETEASLRKLAVRFKAKYHVQLKQLGLYRAPRAEDR